MPTKPKSKYAKATSSFDSGVFAKEGEWRGIPSPQRANAQMSRAAGYRGKAAANTAVGHLTAVFGNLGPSRTAHGLAASQRRQADELETDYRNFATRTPSRAQKRAFKKKDGPRK